MLLGIQIFMSIISQNLYFIYEISRERSKIPRNFTTVPQQTIFVMGCQMALLKLAVNPIRIRQLWLRSVGTKYLGRTIYLSPSVPNFNRFSSQITKLLQTSEMEMEIGRDEEKEIVVKIEHMQITNSISSPRKFSKYEIQNKKVK